MAEDKLLRHSEPPMKSGRKPSTGWDRLFSEFKKKKKPSVANAARVRYAQTHRNESTSQEVRFVDSLPDETKKKVKKKAKELMEPGKGLWAVDDSLDSLGTKLENVGAPIDPPCRLECIQVLVEGCKSWRHYVSGVVFSEATFSQLCDKEWKKAVLKPLASCPIDVGIRVDKSQVPLAGTHGETTPSGLDPLMANCVRFREMGASFILMCTVFKISEYTPSMMSYIHNANKMGRFASISLSAGLNPVLSIELKNDCTDSEGRCVNLHDCKAITEDILAFVVRALAVHRVYLEGVLFRVSPISDESNEVTKAAQATLTAINNRIPPAVGGVLLADSSSLEESNRILNIINTTLCPKPCLISFAYNDVITDGLVKLLNRREKNINSLLRMMTEKFKPCSLASMGQLQTDQHSVFITKVTEMEMP